jgi:serine/threonine protein kinase
MSELIGQQLGQYEITALLGKGGMATVYRARQTSMGRDVALKIIDPNLAKNPDFLKRFERESRTIASLSHAHILKVFDFGQQHGSIYLVMELLRGGSLSHVLKRGRIPLNIVSWLLDQVASALDYAHARSIVHRDLKPHNLLFDDSRNIFLTDFGLAKLLGNLGTGDLTRSGLVVGTPAYMAPEQWKNENFDHRADIYSLGVILYEMLTNKLPFNADTPHRMMYLHLNQAPPPVFQSRPDLPPAVGQILDQAMSKDPELRFPSAGKLALAFKRATSEPLARHTGPLPPLPVQGQSAASPSSSGVTPPMFPSPIPERPTPASSPSAARATSAPAERNVPTSTAGGGAVPLAPAAPSSGMKKYILTPGMRRLDPHGVPQVWVPSGTFIMGNDADRDARPDEVPSREVQITHGFWIDQFPVTNAAFQAFIEDGGYQKRQFWSNDGWRWLTVNGIKDPGNYPTFVSPDQPRVGVSWYEADAYAHWRGCRLPTEAEWEFAARGANGTRFPWGNHWEDGKANVRSKRTTPVNAFADNCTWVKVYDMVGNVWEWCADWYSDTYYQQDVASQDPTGPVEGKGKVLRGGSWRHDVQQARATARRHDAQNSRDDYIGFRVVYVPAAKPLG